MRHALRCALATVVLAALAAACGPRPTGPGDAALDATTSGATHSCTVNDDRNGRYCAEYTGPTARAYAAGVCSQGDGGRTLVEGPCSRAGSPGACQYTIGDVQVTQWFYFGTAETIRESCGTLDAGYVGP